MGVTGTVRRPLALVLVIVVTLAASYVVVAREHIAAIDAFAFPDPTLSVVASRSAAPSGTLIHLSGAPAGAFVELSRQGARAYSPTFADAPGVAILIPPIFRDGEVASGEVELRLLVPRGPLWTTSAKQPFLVEPPVVATATDGIPTLFALHLTHGLLMNAADFALTARNAGGPREVGAYAAALSELRLEVDALSKQFELVAWGNSGVVARPDLAIQATAIGLLDQLTTQFFMGLVEAKVECAATLAADARTGLSAATAEAARTAGTRFAGSLIDCDPQHLGGISARTSRWLSALNASLAEALRGDPQLPKLPTLLELTLISWIDEALRATYVLKEFGRPDALKAYLAARPGLGWPESLQTAAGGEPYFSGQLEGIRARSASEERLLASILTQDASSLGVIAAALEEREPLLATPTPRGAVRAPGAMDRYGVRVCGTLTEHRSPRPGQPGSITVAGEQFSIATNVRETTWPSLRVGDKVCISGDWAYTPDGRTIVRDNSEEADLKFFQYTPP